MRLSPGTTVLVVAPDYPDVEPQLGTIVSGPKNLGERMDGIYHVQDPDGQVWPIPRKCLKPPPQQG